MVEKKRNNRPEKKTVTKQRNWIEEKKRKLNKMKEDKKN